MKMIPAAPDFRNLPLRVHAALTDAGLTTAIEVRRLSDIELLRLPGIGRASLAKIRVALAAIDQPAPPTIEAAVRMLQRRLDHVELRVDRLDHAMIALRDHGGLPAAAREILNDWQSEHDK